MSSNTILVAVEEGIATITLNRPDALNAYNYEMHDALLAALDAVDNNDDARAVIITGAGRGFCAGMDLSAGKETFNREGKTGIDEHRDGGGACAPCATHRPAELSGGEQQRVAFCRALANEPRLLLADEPTGNLDPESSQRIVDLLLTAVRNHGMTLVMVTHDHSLLRQFDHVVDFQKLITTDESDGSAGVAS